VAAAIMDTPAGLVSCAQHGRADPHPCPPPPGREAIPDQLGAPPPPRQLCSTGSHPDFNPCCARVGLLIDGRVRADVIRYDVDQLRFWTLGTGLKGEPLHAAEIVPFWKEHETRQQRRARERWESNHGKKLCADT
jgi:hypothetical protein